MTIVEPLEMLVANAMRRTTERIAFTHEGEGLTCGELLQQANRLAEKLHQGGLRPGEPVVIYQHHDLDLPIAVLGVLFAGGCAVPVNPYMDRKLGDDIVSIVDPRFMVATNRPPFPAALETALLSPRSGDNTQTAPHEPDNGTSWQLSLPAFLVFTSGTMGSHKVVEISREAYAFRLDQITQGVTLNSTEVDLMWTPSSFIGMLDELFYPLLTGVRSVIASPEIRTVPNAFADLVKQENVTRIRITPSVLDAFLRTGIGSKLTSIREIYCSGEFLSPAVQARCFAALPATLWNFYGATEAPGVAFHRLDAKAELQKTTILKIQPFVNVEVQNSEGQTLDIGEVGEIWLGGPTIASGYWSEPEKTASRFMTRDRSRWYRTGDLGRLCTDGQLIVFGRAETTEVKINGVRIEVSHVTEALQCIDGIEDATVVPVFEPSGECKLVGHYVPEQGSRRSTESLLNELHNLLPRTAVPRLLLSYTELPLTTNGKLDMTTLNARYKQHILSLEVQSEIHLRFDNELEETRIATLFDQVLEVEGILIDTDFFVSGGDSLRAVVLASMITKVFGVIVTLEDIVLHPTPRKIAQWIMHRRTGVTGRTFIYIDGDGDTPLFAIGLLHQHIFDVFPQYSVFAAAGIYGDMSFDLRTNVDSLVEAYIDGIRRVESKGPWNLIGFSFGGFIAYEVARRQLERSPESAQLILIEPLTPEGFFVGRSWMSRLLFVLAQLVKGKRMPARSLLTSLSAISPWWPKTQLIKQEPWTAYGQIITGIHRLKPYNGSICLVYGPNFPESCIVAWRQATQGKFQEVKVSTQDHLDLVKREGIQQWKELIIS